MSITTKQIKVVKIDNSDIFLEELGENKGKITISDTYNHNYSYFWGAMGGTLEQFICSINKEYFSDKLLGSKSNYKFDVPTTFKVIRRFLRTEMDLPYYKHMEFQKEMRQVLKDFQSQCEDHQSQDLFIAQFEYSFVNRLPYYLIKDDYEMKRVAKDFKGICEVWNFIAQTESDEYIWLTKLHGKLKAALTK